MINDEAVESGAKVLIEDGRYGVPWEDASEDDRAEAMRRTRSILEAATAHTHTGDTPHWLTKARDTGGSVSIVGDFPSEWEAEKWADRWKSTTGTPAFVERATK